MDPFGLVQYYYGAVQLTTKAYVQVVGKICKWVQRDILGNFYCPFRKLHVVGLLFDLYIPVRTWFIDCHHHFALHHQANFDNFDIPIFRYFCEWLIESRVTVEKSRMRY